MADTSFKDFLLDQLHGLGLVRAKSMFGGWGLYAVRRDGDRFFAIIYDGVFYIKTDATTAVRYQQLGMKPFQPSPKQTLKNYYEVPAEILDDAELLAECARQAVALD